MNICWKKKLFPWRTRSHYKGKKWPPRYSTLHVCVSFYGGDLITLVLGQGWGLCVSKPEGDEKEAMSINDVLVRHEHCVFSKNKIKCLSFSLVEKENKGKKVNK